MGHVMVQVTISNPVDAGLNAEVEALVDTGATFTVVPKSLANRLNLPISGHREVRTATGPITLDMARAFVQIDGDGEINRVLISDVVERVLIGVITLETLSLTVDPTSGELKEAEAFLY